MEGLSAEIKRVELKFSGAAQLALVITRQPLLQWNLSLQAAIGAKIDSFPKPQQLF
ncbi:hypothetical protein [Halioxenophilus sp. WMMB6]|uniref:hypothetical protein n=1 Tax=Halioxenophilus sp. WMMB6 TaxID=3073815 RepID=UPI00295E482A|nr:hypothetical protein [Halioxenophilus sp. WMMB6]